jgi:2-keto-3-deoxy-L-rhamnonate aldolase RhmA
MNIAALTRFRQKLAAGEPVVGLWVTLESPTITEMAVALGLDWVVVDAEQCPLTVCVMLERLSPLVLELVAVVLEECAHALRILDPATYGKARNVATSHIIGHLPK